MVVFSMMLISVASGAVTFALMVAWLMSHGWNLLGVIRMLSVPWGMPCWMACLMTVSGFSLLLGAHPSMIISKLGLPWVALPCLRGGVPRNEWNTPALMADVSTSGICLSNKGLPALMGMGSVELGWAAGMPR